MYPNARVKQKPRCNFCLKEFETRKNVSLHIMNAPTCRAHWDQETARQRSISPSPPVSSTPGQDIFDYEMDVPEEVTYTLPPRERSFRDDNARASLSPPPRAKVEEIEDEEAPSRGRYAREYPHPAADVLGVGMTDFEVIREGQIAQGMESNPWSPFRDEEEWGLAEWLKKRVNQTATDEFLKLPIVRAIFNDLPASRSL